MKHLKKHKQISPTLLYSHPGKSKGVSESGYDRNSNVYLFGVSMTLSEAGVADRYGLGAVELLFSYLDLLRKEEAHR